MELNRIGIYIICYNEEKMIRNTLESVKWADEIIVVDSGSKDRTVEICKEYTEKIYVKEFQGFGKQKNYARSLVTKEWAFNLDADEVISQGLLIEISKLETTEQIKGYYIPRKNYYLGKAINRCGWYPDYKLRLHRTANGSWQDVAVHESYIIENGISYLKNPILHYTYDNIQQHIEKMKMYAEYGSILILESNRRVKSYHLLIFPLITFLKKYIIQLGIMEGYRGILISYIESYYSLLKYAFAYIKGKNDNREREE